MLCWHAKHNEGISIENASKGMAAFKSGGNFTQDYATLRALFQVQQHPCVKLEVLPLSLIHENRAEAEEIIKYRCSVRNYVLDMGTMKCLSCILPVHTTLTEILFYNTGMSDEAVDLLAMSLPCCTAITKMALDYNPLDDPTLFRKFLAQNVPARNISLRGNRLGHAGAIAIADALSANTWALTLNLFDNQIDDCGGLAIVNSVQYNIMLRSLSLANNKCGNKAFGSLINTLTTSEIDENRKMELERCVSRLVDLNKYILSAKKPKAKPGEVPPPNIDEVQLPESITINQVDFLKGNRILEHVNFSNNMITNGGARRAIETLMRAPLDGLNFELANPAVEIKAVGNKVDREQSAELFLASNGRIVT